jgi:hypothetical protein
MANQIPSRQRWVAPKLTVFGDVNVLTQAHKGLGSPNDGFYLGSTTSFPECTYSNVKVPGCYGSPGSPPISKFPHYASL